MTEISVPGRFFFMNTGVKRHVQRAGFEQPLHRVTEHLRR